jgi:hypothetical protein
MGLTGSSMGRALACLSSELLPKVRHVGGRWATWGRVGHKFLCEANTLGREEALANAPEEFRDALALIELDKLPVDSKQWAPEVVFRYDVVADAAQEKARGEMDRPYSGDEDPWAVWGTADVLGVTPDMVVVWDFKFGWGDLVPAAENRQLRTYALMACRALGRSRALVGLCRIRDDGTPWYDRAEMGALELDAMASEISGLCEARELARSRPQSEWPVVEGPHCRHCHSFSYCPAKASLATALGSGEAGFPMPLDERNARAVFERLQAAKAVVAKIDEALELYAHAHPIDLGGGWVYGEKRQPKESIDPVLAEPVLKAQKLPGGTLDLSGAIETRTSVTKKAVEDEVRKQVLERFPSGPKPKGILGKTFERAMEALREANAATTAFSRIVTRHKPDPRELPAASPTPLPPGDVGAVESPAPTPAAPQEISKGA